MSIDPFLPSHHKQGSQQTQGLLGLAGMGGITSGIAGQQMASMESIRLQQKVFSNTFINCSGTGALRDGTGKIVTHPETFIEELQAETNEWLGDTWD